jgi:hypothetical protein
VSLWKIGWRLLDIVVISWRQYSTDMLDCKAASRCEDLVLCLVIAGAVLLLLAPWLFDGDVAIVSPSQLGTDFLNKQWPNAASIVQAWRQWHEVPLWRTVAMGGVPIIGNPSMLLAYPPYWLIFLFPVGRAFTLYFILHLVWAGWGTFGLARRVIRLSSGGALLAALIFALSAKVVAHIGGGHIDIVAALSWLPWLWWAVSELARRPSVFFVTSTTLAATGQALTHLPTLWLSVLLAGCWWLYVRLADRGPHIFRRWLVAMIAGAAALVLAVGLSAVQLGPMLELLPFSTRASLTLSEACRGSLPVPLLIGLALPTALAFPEWVVYVGAVALALAPASWAARRAVAGWGLLVALVFLGTLFSVGCATPFFRLLYWILPGLSWLRIPARMMFLVQLGWALLAGMGWDAVRLARAEGRAKLVAWWIALVVVAAIGFAWTNWFPGLIAVPPGGLAVALLTACVLIGSFHVRKIRVYALPVLAALVPLEAIALSPQLLAREQVSALTSATPVVRFLAAQSGRFRVYSPSGLVSLVQGVAHGLETVDGSDPFQFDHYVRWANAAAGCDRQGYSVRVPTCTGQELEPTARVQAQPDGVLLGIGNVRYLVTDGALSRWPAPVWQSGSVRVYENPSVLPRAFVVPAVVVASDDAQALSILRSRGPSEAATIAQPPESALSSGVAYHSAGVISRTSNYIEVRAHGPGWLVLSEVWSPGWRASVDGMEARVYRTDVAFCGLPLPDGLHTIRFEYVPSGWVWGRWVTAGASVTVLIVVVAGLWRRRRSAAHGRRSNINMPSLP